ncbi:MAG TPA: MFS transporter, partial [Candidatus Caenarcaniphilales bacterium]|nr:MFS transporter [Candidatus Caenarcaniphilales bacterium]
LPAIGREPRLFLDVLEAQNYVQYGYLLTLSALLILAGALTDYYGRRRVFQIGLAGFGVTSLLCGLAPNVELLVLFRLLQGAAGAVLVPGSLALLTTTFEGEEQGRAFGIWAGASGAAAIFGPFFGGLLAEEVTWRAIFFLNLPLIAIALWAVHAHVRESRDEHSSGRFDWPGALLVALAVGGLAFGAIFGQQRQWQDALAFAALGVGAVAAVTLPFYFARAAHPLVPLPLFQSRNFTVTNVSTLLIYGALYVAFFYVPIFLQGTVGYSATAAGIALVPSSVFLVLFSARFGALASRHGPRAFMTAGPLLMGAGLLWLARVPSDTAPWLLRTASLETLAPPMSYVLDVLPAMIVFGVGIAIMVAPLTTALMRSVPPRQAGLASAINNAISRVGPQLCGAVIFIVVTATFYSALQARLPELDTGSPEVRRQIAPLNQPGDDVPAEQAAAAQDASVEAFHLAMVSAAGLLFAGALVNWAGIRDDQALQHAAAVPPEAARQPAPEPTASPVTSTASEPTNARR